MAFPIVPRYRTGSAGNPTSLNLGELAVNTHDGSVYLGADAGVVQIGIPVAAGTEETTWTANGSASQFAPINGYNGTDVGGYLVTVQGIQQPFTVTADNGGTLVFDFTPPTGSVIRARAITQAMGGGGGSSADVQVFSTAGNFTWTKPSGAKSVNVVCIGGGQGGSAGTGEAIFPAFGGLGGAGGFFSERTLNASDLASTESITVGAGGTAGGGAGGNSSFGTYIKSNGANPAIEDFGLVKGGIGGNGGNDSDHPDGYTSPHSFASSGGGGGASSLFLNDIYNPATGGAAGTSCVGKGGDGGNSGSNVGKNGQNGQGYGGGGGGGACFFPVIVDGIIVEWIPEGSGGSGAPGVVIVTTYF
jgi:hypothetical protein